MLVTEIDFPEPYKSRIAELAAQLTKIQEEQVTQGIDWRTTDIPCKSTPFGQGCGHPTNLHHNGKKLDCACCSGELWSCKHEKR